MKDSRDISFFSGPIKNKYPNGETNIGILSKLIGSDKYKYLTEMVRKGKLNKNELDYFTGGGTCSSRADDKMLSYSQMPHCDLDHLKDKYNLDPEAVKRLLSEDKLFNFNLIFVSPSGNGLKAFFTVKGGKAEEHELYYFPVEKHLKETYNLITDRACRNISRACFLCHDPNVYYNASGFIEREALLKMVPAPEPPAPSPAQSCYVSTATSVPSFGKSTYSVGERPSDFLNRDPRVLERSKRALKAIGWIENGVLWRRPGKNGGSSAIFNYFDREDMYFFTNFSSNSPRLGIRGYAPVQLICELEFGGNFQECITQLAHEYL